MARVGIGGVLIVEVRFGLRGPVYYNSPQWRAMVKDAAAEAMSYSLERANPERRSA